MQVCEIPEYLQLRINEAAKAAKAAKERQNKKKAKENKIVTIKTTKATKKRKTPKEKRRSKNSEDNDDESTNETEAPEDGDAVSGSTRSRKRKSFQPTDDNKPKRKKTHYFAIKPQFTHEQVLAIAEENQRRRDAQGRDRRYPI